MELISLFFSNGFLLIGLLVASAFFVSWLADASRPISATLAAVISGTVLCWLAGISPLAWARENPVLALVAIPAYVLIGVAWAYMKWALHGASIRRSIDEISVDFQAQERERVKPATARVVCATEALVKASEALPASQAKIEESVGRPASHGAFRGNPLQVNVDGARDELSRAEDYLSVLVDDKETEARWIHFLRERGVRYPQVKMVSENKARIISWLTYWPTSLIWTLFDDPLRRLFQWVYNTIKGSFQRTADKQFAGIETAWKAPKPATDKP